MKYKIFCSYGEIIDKITILNIKLEKTNNIDQQKNIQNELDAIHNDVPSISFDDPLFKELATINRKLWILEDLIRYKTKKHLYDNQFISYAKLIHETNDLRYTIKKKINNKYNSYLKEEKIYQIENKTEKEITRKHWLDLEKGKQLYTGGEFDLSFKYLHQLIEEFKDCIYPEEFYIQLLLSYNNICTIFNKPYPFKIELCDIMEKLQYLDLHKELVFYCKVQFCMYLLSINQYKESYHYLSIFNFIQGPNVSYDNMSFFKENDTNKTLLLYEGGGLGDIFMYSRFIPIVLKKYPNNKLLIIIKKSIVWLFEKVFIDFKNVNIISDNMLHTITHFDYHCNLISLMKYLKLCEYTIPTQPMFKDLHITTTNNTNILVNSIKKNTYIFNWKGNPNNAHDKYNRSMDLKNNIDILKIKNINLIVITKDITLEEKDILNQNNIPYYGDSIDNEYGFFDSISIMKKVDGVITTDTSIAHLSLNLNVKTYLLLTLGCEWRWKTNPNIWYPNCIMLKQTTLQCWNNVIDELQKLLNA